MLKLMGKEIFTLKNVYVYKPVDLDPHFYKRDCRILKKKLYKAYL